VDEQVRMTQAAIRRDRTLLAALEGKAPPVPDRGDPQLLAEWGDISARMAKFDAETDHRNAELRTVQHVIAKLQTTLPLARQREADIKTLSTQGFMASHAGQDRTRERIEQEQDLATQQARLLEAQAALVESQLSKRAYRAEMQRSLSDRLAKSEQDAAQLLQQGAKTQNREQLMQLTAPVAGTVQQLAVHTMGGVVTPAQALLVVVPDGAEVTAEVMVANKDIGFVRPGHEVAVKVDTFNFTRYGLVPATVLRITPDAVVDEQQGPLFPATLRLHQLAMNIDGQPIKLAAGMTVSAEVKIGRRRVIDFLLSPLQQTMQQSLGER
jgi:hemolysin D